MANSWTKGFLESKTIWGSIMTLAAAGASFFGYTISDEAGVEAVTLITGIVTSVSGLITWYGRVMATKAISVDPVVSP